LKILLGIVLILFVALSCQTEYTIENKTKATGFALGDPVKLRFVINSTANLPDSIQLEILEAKTKYVYKEFAIKSECDTSCLYIKNWDGRKPDGSWPMPGRYYVSARLDFDPVVYSDTVEFGLVD